MNFAQAVAACETLKPGLQPSLQALASAHRRLIRIRDPRRLQASLNLEAQLTPGQPQMRQWDYALGWQAENGADSCCFAEVHPANTDSLGDVAAKKRAMEAWLSRHAPLLLALAAGTARRQGTPVWHWLATEAPIAIRRGSQRAKQLAVAGISGPKRALWLD